jgi:hypothetical protein
MTNACSDIRHSTFGNSSFTPLFLVHSIRLRDPWQCERTDDGATRWTRTFHKPTGLEADDDLWLVLSGMPKEANVTINGHTFAHLAPSPLWGGQGKGSKQVQASDHPSLTLPSEGREMEEYCDQSQKTPDPLRLPARYNVTLILTETNRIEILVPAGCRGSAGTDGLAPPPSSFPFDARLAIMARS